MKINKRRSSVSTVVCLILGSGFSIQTLAATANSSAPIDAAAIQNNMAQISQEAAALQKQMETLQKQLVALKKQERQLAHETKQASAATKQKANPPSSTAAAPTAVVSPTGVVTPLTPNSQAVITAQNVIDFDQPPGGPQAPPVLSQAQQDYYSQLALNALKRSGYVGGSPVTNSTYLGVRSQYDSFDLVVNFSSVNTDLALLQQSQAYQDAAAKLGVPISARPHLNVSGAIQPLVSYQTNYGGGNNSSITLNDAELDLVATASTWITGFLTMEYSQTPTDGPINSVDSSPVRIGRAFVTAGNLNKFPLYLSAGQMYVPFGQYTTYMITDPLTEDLGRTKALAVVLGGHEKQDGGLTGQLYAYQGFTTISNTTAATGNANINQWGANLGYGFDVKGWSSRTTASYINNIADSVGMQSTGNGYNNGFPGFGNQPFPTGPNPNEGIVHNVPGIDAREQLGYGPFNFMGEYTGAARSFDPTNMSFNGHGAKPQALSVEGDYEFNAFTKPWAFSVGYGHSWQALALALPENNYLVGINVAVLRDVLATFEYEHNGNYTGADTASSNNSATPGATSNSPGPHENVIMGEITAFF